jgi:hypothetical protein
MTDQQLADRFEAAELPAWENDSSFQQLLLSFELSCHCGSPPSSAIQRFISEF